MLKKYKGFKITQVYSFSDIFIKRKNISFYIDKDKIFKLYSYSDHGYKVSSQNIDFNEALENIVNQLETKFKTLGEYTVLPRGGDLTLESMKEKHIYWWEKGYDRLHNSEHYKCEVLSSEGFPVESTGTTLLECVECVISEIESTECNIKFQNSVDKLIAIIEETKNNQDSEYGINLDKAIDVFWENIEITEDYILFKKAVDEMVNVVNDSENNIKLQNTISGLAEFFTDIKEECE
jgi:hypothetical protein